MSQSGNFLLCKRCLQLAQCNEMIAAAEEKRKSGAQEENAAVVAAIKLR
jgi:hypothetical protein